MGFKLVQTEIKRETFIAKFLNPRETPWSHLINTLILQVILGHKCES